MSMEGKQKDNKSVSAKVQANSTVAKTNVYSQKGVERISLNDIWLFSLVLFICELCVMAMGI